MSGNVDWLPSELHSVVMRVARADESAFLIGEMSADWSMTTPVELEQVRQGSRVIVRVSGLKPVPPRIALLFSEAVNHLRAALDNVVWYLVEAAQGPVNGRAASMVNLPIVDDQVALESWQGRRVREGLTAFESGTLIDRITALQPFRDRAVEIPNMTAFVAQQTNTVVEVAHPLKLLQGYSNGDKHRTIRAAVPRTRTDPHTGARDTAGFVELKIGNVLAEQLLGFPGVVEQTAAIQVPRPAPYGAMVGPGAELSRLAEYVAHVAIPHLVMGLAAPGALPLSVDLDDCGLTNAERIRAGSAVPALERLKPLMYERHAAAHQQAPRVLPFTSDKPTM